MTKAGDEGDEEVDEGGGGSLRPQGLWEASIMGVGAGEREASRSQMQDFA